MTLTLTYDPSLSPLINILIAVLSIAFVLWIVKEVLLGLAWLARAANKMLLRYAASPSTRTDTR